jgi:hypothetical protein
MRKEQVVCDVCGAQKQETNHWFVMRLTGSSEASFILSLHNADCNWDHTPVDLCGEACVLKKVSELISKQ